MLVFGFIIFVLFFSCSKKPIYKTVVQDYQKVEFSPNMAKQEISDNFNVTVFPADNREIDKETYLAAFRAGTYETEIVSSWKIRASGSTDPTTRMILEAVNLVDRLTNSKYFSQEIGISFKKQLIGKANLFDGSELISLKDSLTDYPDDFNPYKVNEKYLTCFKVILSNESNDLIKIGSGNFQIISGNEQLTPLKISFFESNILGTSEKMKNIFRMNLPDEMELMPRTQIVKYIAVPSIDVQNDRLSVKMIYKDKVFDFDFTVSQTSLNIALKFQAFKVNVQSFSNAPPTDYIVVKQGKRVFSLNRKTIYILSDLTNEPVSLYCLTTAKGGNSFGKVENVILIKLKNFTIKVPMFIYRDDKNK
ncbi:hypothetical protein D4S03_05620 [bacterium]|nr:MAG: hypothetical protein D4S03_05620 [bacterium]